MGECEADSSPFIDRAERGIAEAEEAQRTSTMSAGGPAVADPPQPLSQPSDGGHSVCEDGSGSRLQLDLFVDEMSYPHRRSNIVFVLEGSLVLHAILHATNATFARVTRRHAGGRMPRSTSLCPLSRIVDALDTCFQVRHAWTHANSRPHLREHFAHSRFSGPALSDYIRLV